LCDQDESVNTVKGCSPDRLVFAFEAFPALCSGADMIRTEIWTTARMHVRMAVKEILCLEWQCGAAVVGAFEGVCGKAAIRMDGSIKERSLCLGLYIETLKTPKRLCYQV
jgi:hypothetical protein